MGNNNGSTTGWRILAVDPRGPCRECEIIPFFDYILEINGQLLGRSDLLKTELESNRYKQTKLSVLNYKTSKVREVEVWPSDNWGGIGILGLMIANDNYATADERVIRVLNVFPESPADAAGLHPFVDYVLGTNSRIFEGLDDFEEFVVQRQDMEIRLIVYNSNICQVRDVRITPTSSWSAANDQGVLGCEVSSGLLHKIPDVLPETVITVHEGLSSYIGDIAYQVIKPSNKEDIPICSSDINFSVKEVAETAPLVSGEDKISSSMKFFKDVLFHEKVSEQNAEVSSSRTVQHISEDKRPMKTVYSADVSKTAPIEPARDKISKAGSSSHINRSLRTPEETKLTDTIL